MDKEYLDYLPMKIMTGWMALATVNSVLTSFSPSPTHLLVKLLELMFIRLLLNIYCVDESYTILSLYRKPEGQGRGKMKREKASIRAYCQEKEINGSKKVRKR